MGTRVALRDKSPSSRQYDKVEKRSTWNILLVRECTYNKIMKWGGWAEAPSFRRAYAALKGRSST